MKKQWLILPALAIILISATVFLLSQMTIPSMVERNKFLGFQVRGNKGDLSKNAGYTVLFSHDFDDLGLLARGEYDPEDDPGWNHPNFDNIQRTYETLAIIEDGNDTVFANYYDQGHCGSEFSADPPDYNYHVGTYFSAYINSKRSIGYDDIYFSYNFKTMPGFYIGQEKGRHNNEMKFPGLMTENYRGLTSNEAAAVRMKWSNWEDPGNNYIEWLTGIAEQTTRFAPLVNTVYDTINTTGAWQNFCIRVSTNTGTNKNGLLEFFLDGVLIGQETGKQLVANGNQFKRILISTATLGNYAVFNMDSDKYIYYDDFVVWEGGAAYPARGEPSEKNRILDMPRECELNKQQK